MIARTTDDKGNGLTVNLPKREEVMQTKREHTPGPSLACMDLYDSEERTQAETDRDWYALLLKAVLRGWTMDAPFGIKQKGKSFHDSPVQSHLWRNNTVDGKASFMLSFDASGLPACPDAETFERIRKAVKGE